MSAGMRRGFSLPTWFKDLRPSQEEAIGSIIEGVDDGMRVIFLEAAPGAGKTLIAEWVRRELGWSGVYTCTTLSLQDQFARAFEDEAMVLKGRRNYRTLNGPPWVSCADCTSLRQGMACEWCDPVFACPYRRARKRALSSPLLVLNTAYLLAERLNRTVAGRDLVVIDEADELEAALRNHVEFAIPMRLLDEMEVGLPIFTTKADSWGEWMREKLKPALDHRVTTTRALAAQTTDVKKIREHARAVEMRDKVRELSRVGEDGKCELERGWIFTGKKKERVEVPTWKTVMVDRAAKEMLWDREELVYLLMSGSFLSIQQTVAELGVERGTWRHVHIEGGYEAHRRPILFTHVSDRPMTWHEGQRPPYEEVEEALEAVLGDEVDERVLVHSVSYDLTERLERVVRKAGREAFAYRNARERDEVVARWLRSESGVLVAPSLERGFDLPGDLCRVVVVAKSPAPNLKDPLISARYHAPGGKAWYRLQTVRTLIQMTGRAMRSGDDWCRVYVLDAQVKKLLREGSHLFPGWWKEALVLGRNDRREREIRSRHEEIMHG